MMEVVFDRRYSARAGERDSRIVPFTLHSNHARDEIASTTLHSIRIVMQGAIVVKRVQREGMTMVSANGHSHEDRFTGQGLGLPASAAELLMESCNNGSAVTVSSDEEAIRRLAICIDLLRERGAYHRENANDLRQHAIDEDLAAQRISGALVAAIDRIKQIP
jgi:hypothetical protein